MSRWATFLWLWHRWRAHRLRRAAIARFHAAGQLRDMPVRPLRGLAIWLARTGHRQFQRAKGHAALADGLEKLP